MMDKPATSELFCVFQEGIYRHQCGGVFSTLDKAIAAAKKLIAEEWDDYHEYTLVPFVLDEVSPQVMGAGLFSDRNNLCEPDEIAHLSRSSGVITVKRNP